MLYCGDLDTKAWMCFFLVSNTKCVLLSENQLVASQPHVFCHSHCFLFVFSLWGTLLPSPTIPYLTHSKGCNGREFAIDHHFFVFYERITSIKKLEWKWFTTIAHSHNDMMCHTKWTLYIIVPVITGMELLHKRREIIIIWDAFIFDEIQQQSSELNIHAEYRWKAGSAFSEYYNLSKVADNIIIRPSLHKTHITFAQKNTLFSGSYDYEMMKHVAIPLHFWKKKQKK